MRISIFIRYYEENGLLSPKRNTSNDYRIYTEEEKEKLKLIKFLRELDVPIRDLKLLNTNELSLSDCMKERIKKITYEEENYKKIKNMCEEIIKSNETFSTINIETYFININTLNKEGFTMRKTKTNKSKKILGACFSSLIFGSFFIIILSALSYFQFAGSANIPWTIYIILITILGFPLIGIIYNLINRIKEINGGEEDEASKY